MSEDQTGPIERFFAAERRFYERMPGRDIYNKLFFRTLLWFALFSALYTIVSGL